jgi:hypothetical protein
MLVPSGHAGICVLCVPVRILFDYSARVSKISLVISLSDRHALSYALWKKNRVIVIISIAVSLANTAAFFYSSCLSSLVLDLLTHMVRHRHISRASDSRLL